MSADELNQALEARLTAFLATRGVTRERLVTALDEPFGPPLLIVATGSILQGFGNPRSDVDLNVVVEHKVTRLPIASYESRTLVDTMYFGASEVKDWITSIRDSPWPPAGRFDRHQFDRRSVELLYSTRFSGGLLLSARDGWDRWMAEFRGPWLAEKMAAWWHTESVRKQLAARWLVDAKPLLAAQRRLEAGLAALESRVAGAGQIYFGAKWISEKLRRLGDAEGLDALRALMRMPTTVEQARDYAARDDLIERLNRGSQRDLVAQLWWVPGVAVRELDTRTLVSRWNLRGIELPGTLTVAADPQEPIWEGALDTPLPRDILALFVGDMTWLSLVAKPA